MTNYDFFRALCISALTGVAAFFDSTFSFLFALFIGFAFNIIAGFRADEVKFKLVRLIPPKFLHNFQGNKFKDSLMELFLIMTVTYVLKGIIDLNKYEAKSSYVVQFLIAIACYFYLRNGLRNFHKVYPRNKFISVVYFLLAFEFRKLVGSDVADELDKIEKEAQK
ncbi:MAG TPA: hypothetical protein VI413_10800 [Paludibacter sp.]